MKRLRLQVLIFSLLFAEGMSLNPHAEIRVEEDEVVFMLKAPKAKKAFLVGDFNNWNPTVEMMTKEGEIFRTTMFLSPGNYHYKFVVDGKWIPDPDNPAKDPGRGSELVLMERAGMLTLKSMAETARSEKNLRPSGRLRGSSALMDGDMEGEHQIDLFLNMDEKFARAKVDLITRDDAWSVSPFDKDVVFDRGKLELKVAGGKIVGFENDSVWTSHDPLNLFGEVGVYGYNAGLGRRGITLEEKFLKLEIRAVYSDHLGPAGTKPSAIDSSMVAAFLDSLPGERILYSRDPGYYDEDAFGWELFLDVKELKLGYVRRENRGMHMGLTMKAAKTDSTYEVEVSNSRENWKAGVLWGKVKLFDGLALGAAYGKGYSNLEKLRTSRITLDGPASITLGTAARDNLSRVELQESNILQWSLEFRRKNLSLSLAYRRSDFEFFKPVFENSNAIVDVGTLRLELEGIDWNLQGSVVHTHQDHGSAPLSFSYFSPLANYWLDYADQLTVENMLGFAMHEFTVFRVALSKGQEGRNGPAASMHRTLKNLGAGVMMGSAGAGVEYAYVTGGYERFLAGDLYLQADARVPYYSGSPGIKGGFYADPYVELGYRNKRVELSIGLGLDPVVFDRMRNDYFDIGRLEYLRRGSWDIISREVKGVSEQEGRYSRALELRKNLIRNEESLRRRTRLKIEWIVLF